MKILIYGASAMKYSHSFIAPLRIARVCARYGNEVRMIDWEDDRIDSDYMISGQEEHKWGYSWTYPLHKMLETLIDQIEEWKPDVIYSMGTTQIQSLIRLCSKYQIPLGLHVGDPYFASFPDENVTNHYKQCNFLTFNEGQAWNYIKQTIPSIADKCYLLNHAIDPELSPSWKEVQKINKRYICSCVGGDDRIRRRELVLYYYQWTNKFLDKSFGVGGSLGGVNPYLKNDLSSKVKDKFAWNHTTFTDNETEKFKGVKFNITKIDNDLPYPLGMSHEAVHKLYSESYYGFTPYGYYLCNGTQSQYNTMTFGTKIFEQMGVGCAIISNYIKDIDHIIKQGETGFILHKPEDALEAFKLAIEKPEEVRQMGLNAYKLAHEKHSWNNRYEQVLKKTFIKLGIK